MKKLVLILCALGLVVSCTKTAVNNADNKKDSDFNWSTLTQKSVTLTEISDLINQDGETVATNLAPGTYSLTTGQQTTLSTIPSATKADNLMQFSIPTIESYGTIMIEDLFPNKGDYDMNDMVVDYRIDYLYDNQSLVRTIKINILPRAVGCPEELIGLALNFSGMPFIIKEVIRSSDGNIDKLFGTDETTIINGVQNVIPLTGDLRSHFNTPAIGIINAHNTLPFNQGNAFTVEVKLEKGININELKLFGTNPNQYNIDLFTIIEKRAKEIHLKGQKPTSKFDQSLMGNKLTDFVTADNYVWMMLTDKSIAYPTERVSISDAYPNFDEWVEKDGHTSFNWYHNFNSDMVYNAK